MSAMKKFDTVLVVSHIAYRAGQISEPIEGPYIFLARSLKRVIKKVAILGVPLLGYESNVVFGELGKFTNISVPKQLGKSTFIKFTIDVLISFIFTVTWCIKNRNKNNLVVGVDPLSCFPLLLLKPFFGFTLVFHCVVFNKKRF
jgi:hypothetical protein